MALANYADLTASVANWLNRTDLTAIIPDFVAMAESDISRDLRLRKADRIHHAGDGRRGAGRDTAD